MATSTPAGYRARLLDLYEKTIGPELAQKYNITNTMAIPKLEKVVVNMGVGRATQDKGLLDAAVDSLTKITGQKPLITRAKVSVASSGFARATRSAARSLSAASGCTSSWTV